MSGICSQLNVSSWRKTKSDRLATLHHTSNPKSSTLANGQRADEIRSTRFGYSRDGLQRHAPRLQ